MVEARTDVPFVAGFTRVGIAAGAGALAASPDGPWSAGNIGSLTLVPRDRRDGPISIALVLAKGRAPESCLEPGDTGRGCIISRRRLAFIPSRPLRVQMVLWNRCEGVSCRDDQTCDRVGRCVEAAVDPAQCAEGDGCVLPGDPRPGDAIGQSDAGSDTGDASPGPDAQPDASSPLLVGLALDHLSSHRTCALWDDGALKCWGFDFQGALGQGEVRNRGDQPGTMGAALAPVNVGRAGHKVVEVATAGVETCVRFDDGLLKCWGFNASGELGLGDKVPRGATPASMGDGLPTVDLGAGKSVTRLALGLRHACALLNDGRLKCWGSNDNGALGVGPGLGRGGAPGEMGDALPAVTLPAGRSVVSMCAGDHFTCVATDDGQARCWGRNDFGQLGQGDTTDRGMNPGDVAAMPNIPLGMAVTQVACGSFHACALGLVAGAPKVKCWGREGALGTGSAANVGPLPGQVAALPPIDLGGTFAPQAIACGDRSSCAISATGALKCWGNGGQGRLGLGNEWSRGNAPGEMGDALPFVNVGTNLSVRYFGIGQHACAALPNQRVRCWGSNAQGQLGVEDTLMRGDAPERTGDALPFAMLGRP